MFKNMVYISQLRPDFDVIDLENELQLDANPDEVILDYAIPNNNAVFLAFVGDVTKLGMSRETVLYTPTSRKAGAVRLGRKMLLC